MLVKPLNIPNAQLTKSFYYLGAHALNALKTFLLDNGLSFEDEFYKVNDTIYTAHSHEELKNRMYIVLDPDNRGLNIVPYEKFWVSFRPLETNLF